MAAGTRAGRSHGTLILWGIIAFLWMIPVASGQVSVWFALGQLGVAVGVLFALIVTHEMGHAILGWLLGYRVFEVSIGAGYTLVQAVIGRTIVRFSLVPAGGHTLLAPKGDRLVPAREVFVSLAGPAVNLVTLLWAIVAEPPPAVRFPAIAMGVVLVVGNLWPRQAPTPLGVTPSDGLRAAHALDLDDAQVRQLIGGRYLGESYVEHVKGDHEAALAWDERGLAAFPDDPSLSGDVATSLLLLGRFEGAQDRLRRLLARDDLLPLQRALFQNNLAWADLMSGDPSLVAEALAASEAAFAELPMLPAVQGTRGFALILSGAIDDGIDLCTRSSRRHRVLDDRASNLCAISIGAARQGRVAAAERHLTQAIRLSPENRLIDRAGAELRSAREAAV
ncbi:MAG TPA: site-2 protease family protein [Actinomycetota bacterium]|nr:site-2 protease family protein [Actinomycetota bacterium]